MLANIKQGRSGWGRRQFGVRWFMSRRRLMPWTVCCSMRRDRRLSGTRRGGKAEGEARQEEEAEQAQAAWLV